MPADIPQDVIELRVDKIAQLFHSLDPYPFRERDLDKNAEDYIVGFVQAGRRVRRKFPVFSRVSGNFTDKTAAASNPD
jgi:hypothetical protein